MSKVTFTDGPRLVGDRNYVKGDTAEVPDEVAKRLAKAKVVVPAAPDAVLTPIPAPATPKETAVKAAEKLETATVKK